ncbi:MAG: STAS domain-containing protein [candidate division Zixibacteria bacterium]|nr:STAS domain-containing protein [Candidatus Tariuqbacter arcticus]
MTISAYNLNDIKVISTLGSAALDMQGKTESQLLQSAGNGNYNTVVDLNNTDELDLPLLYSLIRLYNSCRDKGRSLILVNIPRSAEETLNHTGLNLIFDCADSIPEAVSILQTKSI